MSDLPTNLNEELEQWGLKHLYGHFMFEEGWLNAKRDLEDLVQSICLSVIGEDEEISHLMNETLGKTVLRNQLRAEQRLSLEEKIG